MQKALDDLVRHYIISETRYEKAEKEDGPLEGNINQDTFEDEYIKALYDCLENKGVVRELQTFLRQRLVAILQDKWPNLGGQDELVSFNPVAIRLVQDFLCSHQLLYTFSVLASEIGQMFSLKQPFGKLPFPEAERILDQMEIRKIGSSRERILQCYLEKDRFSLLECIICICPWACQSDGPLRQKDFLVCNEKRVKQFYKPTNENTLHLRKTLDGTKKNVNEESKEHSGDKEVKERLRKLEESMQNEQESYTMAISRYKEEDAKRIYDEIETQLKFEMLTKEKELLQNYEEKATSMRKALDKERELWLSQKDREENELFQHKERIILLMNSLTEKQQIIKSMLENYQGQYTTEAEEFQQKERNYQLKEAELSSTIQKLREENKILKKMQSMKRENPVVQDFQPTTSTNNKVIMTGSPVCETNNDTIAFLKYSLECQADEIKLLRSSFANSRSQSQLIALHQEGIGLTSKNSDHVKQSESKEVREKHLEQFIKDSKRRCDEIEKEAKEIEYSLEAFKNRSMGKPSTINKSSVISSKGRLNLLPSVPKIDYSRIPSLLTSTELSNPVDQTTYFSNLLNQMFPSRDFSLPRTKQHTQTETNDNNPTEMVRPQVGTYESIKEKFKSATIDADMISQFQENLTDLKKLVNTSIISPAPYKGVLNVISENGEAPNQNSVQITHFPANNTNSLTDTRLSVPKKVASYPQSLQTSEISITEYAGGDAKIFATHEKDKNKNANGIANQYQPTVPVPTNTNRRENSNTIMEVKASESGALIKAKVPSPPLDDQNNNGDKSETSISIRSVMKTKISFETNQILSRSKPLQPEYDDGDPNYVTDDELDDVSISAPDISQSQAEDFWNV